ncbi:hypothetical protein SASC598P14_000060, partial [Snodgrassella alvi SCGC AB-598-P14]
QAEWQPCPMELLEKIILHFYNHVSELNLVRMLASRKNNISKSIINILCKLTKFYPDPKLNTLSVYTSDHLRLIGYILKLTQKLLL